MGGRISIFCPVCVNEIALAHETLLHLGCVRDNDAMNHVHLKDAQYYRGFSYVRASARAGACIEASTTTDLTEADPGSWISPIWAKTIYL